MYPEDRLLVAYVPTPRDFELIRSQGWYRIPQKYSPKGLHAEYIAFYFGRRFGQQKWAIHYFAANKGHELVRRIDLLPDEPDHPRAQEIYHKIQLGPIQSLERPIISLHWRRILFIHTTWDRFQVATEINDLLLDGDDLVDRKFSALQESHPPDTNYQVSESQADYLW